MGWEAVKRGKSVQSEKPVTSGKLVTGENHCEEGKLLWKKSSCSWKSVLDRKKTGGTWETRVGWKTNVGNVSALWKIYVGWEDVEGGKPG